MKNLKNLGFIGAGAAGAVALTMGVAGVAGAQEDDPVLVDPDAETSDADRPSRGERRQAMIDQLVEEGVITQEQADDLAEIRDAVQAHREEQREAKKAEIADVLGITVDELEAAKEEGQTLAEIAGDNLPALVDYMVDQATERINDAVESGRITQEQADERLDGLADRIEDRLENGGGFGRRDHGRRGHGPRGFGGGFGGGDAPAAEVSTT